MIEELAKIEHEQWMEWSKSLAETEEISEERLNRWKKYWVDYEELDYEVKEYDRAWARKVMKIYAEVIEREYHSIRWYHPVNIFWVILHPGLAIKFAKVGLDMAFLNGLRYNDLEDVK